jgi:hypothetical protein
LQSTHALTEKGLIQCNNLRNVYYRLTAQVNTALCQGDIARCSGKFCI